MDLIPYKTGHKKEKLNSSQGYSKKFKLYIHKIDGIIINFIIVK